MKGFLCYYNALHSITLSVHSAKIIMIPMDEKKTLYLYSAVHFPVEDSSQRPEFRSPALSSKELK